MTTATRPAKPKLTAATDPIDPERAMKLAGITARSMFAAGTKMIGPFEKDDFEQELLLFCYDHAEQSKRGWYIRESDKDTHVMTVLKRYGQDWRQWAIDTRDMTDGAVGFSLDNRDHAESEAFTTFATAERRIERDRDLLVDDSMDIDIRIHQAIEDLERSLKALRAAVPPVSEVQQAITRAVRAKPGESNLTDALRRCVAWAAWRLVKRGRSDDVRLMFRRYRHGEQPTGYERNRLANNVLPDMAREMNKYLVGETDYDHDGPGSRRVRKRYTPGDGDRAWDDRDESVEDAYTGEFLEQD